MTLFVKRVFLSRCNELKVLERRPPRWSRDPVTSVLITRREEAMWERHRDWGDVALRQITWAASKS